MFEINVLGFQDFANGRRLRKSAVMAETRQEPRNALWRRAEQIARWNQSETNQVSGEPKSRDLTKVKFQDGCVFLAACSSGDTEEVELLLEFIMSFRGNVKKS